MDSPSMLRKKTSKRFENSNSKPSEDTQDARLIEEL